MSQKNSELLALKEKIALLSAKQDDLSEEVSSLRATVRELQTKQVSDKTAENTVEIKGSPPQESPARKTTSAGALDLQSLVAPSTVEDTNQSRNTKDQALRSAGYTTKPKKRTSSLEAFIGENLINKIGIAITVIGIAVGAKYSIDNDLLSPLTRIVFGYMAALGLLLTGMKLKQKYPGYSAVLVSGSMATFYFITFFAYDFYDLIPQSVAFGLMVVFTVFTVFAALQYNLQAIAVIGLVGAYGVPFLLSEGSGKVEVLFSYMALLNAGILAVSYRKYWKALSVSSFCLTWIIYLVWYVARYDSAQHFALAFVFLSVFFVLFYAIVLAYKLFRKEEFLLSDTLLVLCNGFLFYGIGFHLLDASAHGYELLGLFTVANAFLHFIVSTVLYKSAMVDKRFFYLITGLVFVFIAIAIPVQLEGNWVTLLWIALAVVLFWIGRSKQVRFYEYLSYAGIVLSWLSLRDDWLDVQYFVAENEPLPLFWNQMFLTSILWIAGGITILYWSKRYLSAPSPKTGKLPDMVRLFSFLIPALVAVSGYAAVHYEIENYWLHVFDTTKVTIPSDLGERVYFNYDTRYAGDLWVMSWLLCYGAFLAWVTETLKSTLFGRKVVQWALLLGLVILCAIGLPDISTWRMTSSDAPFLEYFESSNHKYWMPYMVFALAGVSLWFLHKGASLFTQGWKRFMHLVVHIVILFVLSTELLFWMEQIGMQNNDKLSLTILWAAYALFLVVLGIKQKLKYLRIAAISLFAFVLLKLFVYDISHLDTLAKTLVLVILGVLLLLISFLYNKYKYLISDEPSD